MSSLLYSAVQWCAHVVDLDEDLLLTVLALHEALARHRLRVRRRDARLQDEVGQRALELQQTCAQHTLHFVSATDARPVAQSSRRTGITRQVLVAHDVLLGPAIGKHAEPREWRERLQQRSDEQ